MFQYACVQVFHAVFGLEGHVTFPFLENREDNEYFKLKNQNKIKPMDRKKHGVTQIQVVYEDQEF
jgi:hypothetical protein